MLSLKACKPQQPAQSSILTPPTTPDDSHFNNPLLFNHDISVITFNDSVFNSIQFRGKKTVHAIKVKAEDLFDHFRIPKAYYRTIGSHMVGYSLRDLYIHDYFNIKGSNDYSLFSKFKDEEVFFVTYNGLKILSENLPKKLRYFMGWLDSEIVNNIQPSINQPNFYIEPTQDVNEPNFDLDVNEPNFDLDVNEPNFDVDLDINDLDINEPNFDVDLDINDLDINEPNFDVDLDINDLDINEPNFNLDLDINEPNFDLDFDINEHNFDIEPTLDINEREIEIIDEMESEVRIINVKGPELEVLVEVIDMQKDDEVQVIEHDNHQLMDLHCYENIEPEMDLQCYEKIDYDCLGW